MDVDDSVTDSWPPSVLREYALLADGERGVLVGPGGAMVWMCFPRWDSPAVLAALVGGGGGYRVRPAEDRCVWGGHYEDGGLVWRNRWTTSGGRVECRDALALPGRADTAVILRRVTAVEGPAAVTVRLALRSDFGRGGMRELRRGEDGCWRGRLGDGSFCWSGAGAAEVVRDGRHYDLELGLRLAAGESHDLVLALGTGTAADTPDADGAWAAVESGWARRVPAAASGRAARDVRHAQAVLHGLTSSSGGMVAAATLGLPERAAAGRNYDYRYAWIRDQCFAGQAAAVSDDDPLLAGAVRFVGARLLEHGPDLAPAYRVDGGPVPDETRLDLPGYPGGADVVGNWVNGQFQLDAFGEALLLFAAADRRGALDADGWAALRTAAAAIGERHDQPDAGIWELDDRMWTQSRLQCVAGLRAVAALPGAGAQGSGWAALADSLLASTAAGSVHPAGRWQRAPDDPRLDSALLLPAVRGAVPPGDPRTVATLRAVLAELTEDGYCYRFRHGDEPLSRAEGAFLLCGFLVSLSLLDQGDLTGSASWFERTRAACGPPGLLTEEFDVRQRQLRGNLPQAFVHAMLIETAHRLDQAGWAPSDGRGTT